MLEAEFSNVSRGQHVLQHQLDSGSFIRKCADPVKDDGVIAITVPPLKHKIVGGQLTLWNAGLLLYQMVFNGLDFRGTSVFTYSYNVSVIVRKRVGGKVDLTSDNGDITKLKDYFPNCVDEPFDGQISQWNW